MRRFFTAIIYSLLLLAGVAMAFSAADKKEDKKDGGKDKGQKPIVIIIWEPAWPPIFREVPVQNAGETCFYLNEPTL